MKSLGLWNAIGNNSNLGVLQSSGAGPTYETPAYENEGGTGDRQSIITITTDLSIFGEFSGMVDGNTADGPFTLENADIAGKEIVVDFRAIADLVKINEIKFYKTAAAQSLGTWQMKISTDGAAYANTGSKFELGGTGDNPQILTIDAEGFGLLKFVGVSGSTPIFQMFEFEFKIGSLQ